MRDKKLRIKVILRDRGIEAEVLSCKKLANGAYQSTYVVGGRRCSAFISAIAMTNANIADELWLKVEGFQSYKKDGSYRASGLVGNHTKGTAYFFRTYSVGIDTPVVEIQFQDSQGAVTWVSSEKHSNKYFPLIESKHLSLAIAYSTVHPDRETRRQMLDAA